MQRGREVYNYRCYFCHGYNGDARTLAASFLDPAPRSFIDTDVNELSREQMIKVVSYGSPGTAMKSFSKQISSDEIEAVVDFVRERFMRQKQSNSRYHTPENGWHQHEKYRDAYPFALGEIPLDVSWEQLSDSQRRGWQLFMQGCVSCHDRAKVSREGEIWESRPLSFPRNGYSHRQPDAVSGASPYSVHEQSPPLPVLNEEERIGQTIFEQNCAFCHASNGSGKNWIGQFILPHPRDFRDANKMAGFTRDDLAQRIAQGVEGTAMPAWKTVLDKTQINAVASYVLRLNSSAQPKSQ